MSYYGVTYPEYWTGPTGRAIRRVGGKDAQLLGLYLTSCRFATLLGLYRVTLDDMQHEVGLRPQALQKALRALEEAGFAAYDAAREHVWVYEMARFRLGLRDEDAKLDPDDNRAKAARRLYDELPPNTFLARFHERYGKALHLGKRREPPTPPGQVDGKPLGRGSEGASPRGFSATPQDVAPSKGLRRGSEGACKPVNRSVPGSGSVPERSPARVRRFSPPEDWPKGGWTLYLRLGHEAWEHSRDEDHAPDDLANATAWFKQLCAGAQVRYDSDIARRAIDAAAHVRERRRA